ncbi:AsmA family protein [Scleromatobacter humisilvae]|uniref:AsmA family protein n=1 Tax=Scleromatobacter humisilvae TaxID=2897159 RepID=A0A9X1YI39_9BURK|nr:AsmA family protein [Scleromatobacter humisilvae]MCK9686142.1 AsmA family protein [Scleromatobacter humisilvae]
MDRANPDSSKHRWRNAGLGVLGVVVLLVVAICVCEAVEWPFLRHPLENKLSQILDRPVAFGDQFGVRLFGSVRAHTDSMTIGPAPANGPTLVDDAGKPRDFMHASNVKLALGYRTLYEQWKGTGQPIAVKLLDVDGLELNLKRNADGHANWQFGAAQPATSASSAQLPSFERLNVRNGAVRIVDEPLQITADARVTTREGTAEAAAIAASGASTPQVRVATVGSTTLAGSAPIAASGGTATPARQPLAIDDDTPGLQVDGKGTYRKAPLLIQLRSSGLLPLAASDSAAVSVPLWLDVNADRTHIRVDGTATDLLHFGGMDATFVASGPSLAAVGDALGVTLPTTAKFATHGRLRKHGSVWDAGIAAMDIGTSRLNGSFKFDNGPDVPVLTGTLGGARLALADLGPAFGAAPPDAPASASNAKPGKVIPDRAFDIPSLKAMNADVGVQLAVLDLGTRLLEPFKPLQGRITLQDGVLNLKELLARTSAGEVQGGIGLDSRPAVPKWNADLRWSGIQLDRFLKARDVAVHKDASGAKADVGYISGALGGNAQLKGEGNSSAKLLASLDGTARLWVRDGTVSHILVEAAGIDVAQALGVFVKGDDKLPMQCALAQFDLVNGKVMPEVFVIDTKDTTMLIDGDLSLAAETLDLRMTAHPHDTSPLALRTPVKVTGTFDDPHIRPEAKPLVKRGVAAVGLSLINPLAALLALVDLRQQERDVCTAAVSHVQGAAAAGVKTGPATAPPVAASSPAAKLAPPRKGA